jgi:hypothetical protein
MLLSRNRLFERKPPSREAKIIYIFCEGLRREVDYFKYFREMDSRIHLEIYELNPNEDNSPRGMLAIAKTCLLVSVDNPAPKYSLQNGDEVWIVLDTDPDFASSRKPQIAALKAEIQTYDRWSLVESNPCFEVWLYYHGNDPMKNLAGMEACAFWKNMLNTAFSGGFDTRKHPIFIEEATQRARESHEVDGNGDLALGSTEVFLLAESMLKLLAEKIRDVKNSFNL